MTPRTKSASLLIAGLLGLTTLAGSAVAEARPTEVSMASVEAAQKLRYACKAGNAEACAQLAAVYETGTDLILRNQDRAQELHRQACRAGAARSCESMQSYIAELGTAGWVARTLLR
jgi:TPR repeat protein